jgi:hypothetical protein
MLLDGPAERVGGPAGRMIAVAPEEVPEGRREDRAVIVDEGRRAVGCGRFDRDPDHATRIGRRRFPAVNAASAFAPRAALAALTTGDRVSR